MSQPDIRECSECGSSHSRSRPLCGKCEYQRRKKRERKWPYTKQVKRSETLRSSSRQYWRKSKSYRKRNSRREKRSIKYYIRDLVRRAIKLGLLARPQKCMFNNRRCKGQIEAHHPDYNRPLKVMWMCRTHHVSWHRLFLATEIED